MTEFRVNGEGTFIDLSDKQTSRFDSIDLVKNLNPYTIFIAKIIFTFQGKYQNAFYLTEKGFDSVLKTLQDIKSKVKDSKMWFISFSQAGFAFRTNGNTCKALEELMIKFKESKDV